MSITPAILRTALVLLACALLPGLAGAEESEAVISTGQEGGSYYAIGQRLREAMQLQHHVDVGVQTSNGSIQNLARLADPDSEVSIALTQTDALSRFLRDNADFSNQFIVLGDVGRECALLIADKSGAIGSFSDLENASDAEVSVDALGSGAAVTFDYLKTMDPGLAKVKLVYVDTMEALLQLKVGGPHTRLKAAMLVQRPSTRSEAVRILVENPKDYRLVPIRSSDVANHKLPDGSVVYSFAKVKVGDVAGVGGLEVETLCTRGLLLASKQKLDRDVRSQLAKTMLESSKTVIGEND
jgi:TRAP-type uncharacterized transport system substrate-binding protein